MSVKLNSSSGGSVTLQEPTTASNFTLTLPAQTATVITDSSAILNIGSGQIYKDASGNVGIGTSSPVGNFQISGANPRTRLTNTSGTATTVLQGSDSGAAFIGTETNAPYYFVTNSTERARITSGGDFAVGATVAHQGGKISLQTTVNSCGIGMYLTGTGNTTGTYLNCGDDAAIKFRVYSNGNVQNANNSYGSTSDIKIKENISDATPKLEKLQQVRVVNFNVKGDTQKQIGVIAQEVEQVFPGMVYETCDTDDDGNDLGTTTKSVKYSVFVPMLIKAIQELKADLDAAKAEIAALKGSA